MKIGSLKRLALGAVLLAAAPAMAQVMPDIGFKSVGRGRPLAASVYDQKGGRTELDPRVRSALRPGQALPAERLRAECTAEKLQALGARHLHEPGLLRRQGALDGIRATTAATARKRRSTNAGSCPSRTERKEDKDSPWGHCELGLPREAIVSPYGFKTAQEHYEALMKETQGRGGPKRLHVRELFRPSGTASTSARRARGPLRTTGTGRQEHPDSDGPLGADPRVPTAHGAGGLPPDARLTRSGRRRSAGRKASCDAGTGGRLGALRDRDARPRARAGRRRAQLPQGHLRRPQIQHGGRGEGGVPALGAAVPRWYGETVGFWDKDVLITWTSNIQGWKSHSEFEFSNKLQSVEIYTPMREGTASSSA